MNRFVTVIMPVYNGEQYLAEAIQSVLTQSFSDFELVIVDDGSTDGSGAIVQQFLPRYPNIRYLYQENAGVSAARNTGITANQTPLIAFLDQDDRWTKDTLQHQITYHQSHPEVGYTLGHQICFLEAGIATPKWFLLQKLDLPHIGYLPGTLMVKRWLFDQLGLFDTQYPISSDADWFARANDAKIPMHILSELILERRIHGRNQSQQAERIHTELFQLLQASIQRKKLNQ